MNNYEFSNDFNAEEKVPAPKELIKEFNQIFDPREDKSFEVTDLNKNRVISFFTMYDIDDNNEVITTKEITLSDDYDLEENVAYLELDGDVIEYSTDHEMSYDPRLCKLMLDKVVKLVENQ